MSSSIQANLATNPMAEPIGGNRLRAMAVRGLKWASLATAGKTFIDMLAQLALVRLLAPEHFGVFAFAQALSGFVSCFTDLAGQRFLVRQTITVEPRTINTVFWFELLLGSAVALLWFVGCAPLLESLGHADQIPFARGLALWIISERLLLPRAVLDRAMRFGPVNLALSGGVLLGSIVMIAFAVIAPGPWCFVAGLVARTAISAAFMWRAARFVPRWHLDFDVVRDLFRFGAPLALTTALAFAYTNVDYLIVGGLLGYASLGLYTAAYRYPHYLNQFNVVLSSIVFPSFAKAVDDAHLERGLRLLTRYSAAIAFLPVIAMWFEGEAILTWVLGAKWVDALFPFQCFTTLAAMRLAFVHWNQIYVVKGLTRTPFVVSLLNLPIIAMAAFFGARAAGIDGAAAAITICSLAMLAACCAVLLPRLLGNFSYLEAVKPILQATLAAIVAGLGAGLLPLHGASLSVLRLVAIIAIYALTLHRLVGAEFKRLATSR